MSTRRQLGCLAVTRHFKPQTNHIWITDNILNDALYRFTRFRLSRRHGSSIPGPLEARRRAAKRRMMNLTHLGGRGAIDSGLLTGLNSEQGSRSWQWQTSTENAVREPVPQAKDSPLPSWLTDTNPIKAIEHQPPLEKPMSHSSKTPRKVRNSPKTANVAPNSSGSRSLQTILAAGKGQKNLQSKGQFVSRLKYCNDLKDVRKLLMSLHLKGQENLQSKGQFVSRLKYCNDLKDIRMLLMSLNLDLSSNPLYSKLAFKRLLRTQCGLGEIMSFLEDPSFNAPEARNLDALPKWYVKYSNRDREKILPWITQRVSQGILHGEELLSFVQTVSSLNGEVEFDDCSGSFSQVIFKGLSSSTIFTFHDVEGILLLKLLGCFTSRLLSPERKSLGVETIKRSSPSQLRVLGPGIPPFLNSCLMPQNRKRKTPTFDPKPVSKILEFLLKAPMDLKIKCIRDTSNALLIRHECPSNKLSVLLKNLEKWWSLLSAYGMFKDLSQSVEWFLFERKLARHDVRILASYLRLFSHKQICCFLLRNWFAPEIGNQATRHLREPLPIEEEFEANLTLPQNKVSPFVVMVQSLGPELPSSSKWISSLFSLLREIGESSTILKIVTHRQKLGLPISLTAVINEINEQSNRNFAIAFRLFKSTPTLTLENCPSVAKIMISNPRFNPMTAQRFRYMRQQFHAPHERYFREPFDIFGEWGRGNFPPRESEPVRRSRAFLLESMAIAYAEATHLFASVAWRHVLRCWKLHQRYCLGPTGLDMSRALVISGVVRWLQENKWVPPDRIRWILGIVREVEGEEVASGLDRGIYEWRQKVAELNNELKARRRRWRDMDIKENKPPKRSRPRGYASAEWLQKGDPNGRNRRELNFIYSFIKSMHP